MSISELISFLKAHGLGGSLLVIVGFIIWAFLKSDWVSKKLTSLFDKILDRKPKNSINISHIVNHNMFNYIDFWIYSKVPTLNFSTEYRTIVFRKYLTILLMKYRDNVQKYISSAVYEKMDEQELWKSVLTLLNTIVYDYEKEMESMGIPKIVINKMKARNNETITLIIELTESVCSCEFYNSEHNLLKIYTIQNILLAVLQNAIFNSEIVCNTINGDLKGQYVIVDGKKIIEKDEH
jgi:hypothetical protein